VVDPAGVLVKRLGTRLLLILTLAILAITVAYDFLRLQREHRTVFARLEREVSLVARAVEGPLWFWMRTGNREQLESLLRDIREAKGAICVAIYDLNRRLTLASSADQGNGDTPGGCPEALDAEVATESILDRVSPLGTFRIVAPLTREGARVATLAVALPSTAITDPIRRQRIVLIAERALVLATIGITLWLAISALVSRPIRELVRGVEEIGRGNLGARIAVKTQTEIASLAQAFNRMAESLQESQRRYQAEENRRITLERQLRHADKLAAIGKLTSELAHEVGSPLNVIAGRARILRREFPDGDARGENLDIIRRQVDRISGFIKRLLKLARPSQIQKERIDLAPLIGEVATFLAPELQRRQARLALLFPPALPAVMAERDGLLQVLLNLVMNAMAAIAPGGRIEVAAVPAEAPAAESPRAAPEAESNPSGVEVRVTDDGHGIAPEILPRVFEPFFSTKPEEGTGLGLSICQDIVRDHGGRITAESQPGQGATFRIWLPAAPREALL